MAGGIVYENYGFKGASLLGSFLLGFELLSILMAFYIQQAINTLKQQAKQVKEELKSGLMTQEEKLDNLKFREIP